MKLTLDNLNDINIYLDDVFKQKILDKISLEKRKEKIFKDVERLEEILRNNKKCTNLKTHNMYLYGDFRYTYNEYKEVSIDILSECVVEVRIENYCYSTDSVSDVIKVLPDIHIAMDKGII